MDCKGLSETIALLQATLLASRNTDGIWRVTLSSSALATASAVGALALLDGDRYAAWIDQGLKWLADNINDDGGWGDTPDSGSNLAATLLAWSAMSVAPDDRYEFVVTSAGAYLHKHAGGTDGRSISRALERAYGKDKTFAVPILSFAAATGRLGSKGWKYVKQLPFELGGLSHKTLKYLRLPVVSYALPALIAIGQARHFHRPTLWPVHRWMRNILRSRTLRKLQTLQPDSGGFLEAIPLTAFVAVALASFDRADHPVSQKAAGFLVHTAREDGSWPIDTDLSTWVTTLTTNAIGQDLGDDQADDIRNHLLQTQLKQPHPFTQADPGGWAWTDLSGGVPDADDTSSALLALMTVGPGTEHGTWTGAITGGVRWLCDLQNRDGGWPTFCRGWGKLPFDRSAPELTAHAIAALSACRDCCKDSFGDTIDRAILQGISYLGQTQNSDGSFIPLWFGNEHAPGGENPVYGTARVLKGLMAIISPPASVVDIAEKAAGYLRQAQCDEGGWGAVATLTPSVEETAVAVEALSLSSEKKFVDSQSVQAAIRQGVQWLISATSGGKIFKPSPIGLYFARLWYSELAYPPVFTLSALQAAVRTVDSGPTTSESAD